jgi:hypothetical protein
MRSLTGVGAAGLADARVVGAKRALGTELLREELQLLLDQRVTARADEVVNPRTFAPVVDDPRSAQNSELPRRIRLADSEPLLDVTHAELAVHEQCDDPQAGLVAKCPIDQRERSELEGRCGHGGVDITNSACDQRTKSCTRECK